MADFPPDTPAQPACTPRALNILRRRVLPIASTAAAISLAGCATQPPATANSYNAANSIQETQVPSSMLTTQQRTLEKVTNFTEGLDATLKNLDPHKLTAPASLSAATQPATQPAPQRKAAAIAKATVHVAVATQPSAVPATQPASPIAATQPAATEPVAATQPAPEKVAAAPLAAPEPSVDEALAVLRKNFASHPTLNSVLGLALLDSADGRAPDLSLSTTLPSADQQILNDLLNALQGMTTPLSVDLPITDRAAPLIEAARHWQAEADLTLPKLALASRVDSFGVYTPVDPRFEQGVRRNVIIYCEVANFASKKSADGWYVTRLSQQETLITEDGLMVFRPNAEEVVDRSLNQRHDFYLVKKLTIPDTLPIGKYVLRMSVTDRTSNKIAMVSMPIEVIPRK